jgi:fermentation-respiration switch protein FrsA (DUF1100 family)
VIIRMIERSLVYPIPSRERGDWRPRWLRPQNVWFRAADDTKLHGWYIPHAEPKRLVIYCHGNGEHVADQANLMFRLQANLQATLFVFDYRGYGRSRGKPYEKGCIADGLAAQRWLARKEGVSTEDITVIGRSIGGGVAVAVAAEQGARALVLENTFSKMTDAAAHQYPWLPVKIVMRNRYNSLRRIKKYHGPLFQCHGTADDIVPIGLGRALFDAAPTEVKQFYEVNFARHNDSLPPNYYQALSAFLDQVDEAATQPAARRRAKRQLVS